MVLIDLRFYRMSYCGMRKRKAALDLAREQ